MFELIGMIFVELGGRRFTNWMERRSDRKKQARLARDEARKSAKGKIEN